MFTLLTSHNLSVDRDETTLFSGVGLSIAEKSKIGLVGKNGSGKSTLLKVLAGLAEPSAGSVTTSARTYYMPQVDLALVASTQSVAVYCAEHDSEWPLVEAELHKLFKNEHITKDKEIKSLSGGELIKLTIAIGATKKPDLLLLDEPTNHLDVAGLAVLEGYLKKFQGAYVVVSHDPLFLNRTVSHIWAIEDDRVIEYGGNYADYQEALRLKEESRVRAVEDGRKNLRKQRHALERTETRAARGEREQRRIRADDAKDKFAKGAAKDNSERSAGKGRVKLKGEIEESKKKLTGLAASARRSVHFALTEHDTGRRTLIDITHGQLSVGDRKLLDDIAMTVRYGDRVAIVGANGSGKSAFVQSLVGIGAAVLTGDLRRGAKSTVYVDQKYQTIDPNKTVLQNMESASPTLAIQEIRDHLGRFMFGSKQEVSKSGVVLSGGEAARLTLAMVTAQPVDLLILDEPTNNLDIETLDIIAEGLRGFAGALVVVSHNVHFLQKIGVDTAYALTNSKLTYLTVAPTEPELFYEALRAL